MMWMTQWHSNYLVEQNYAIFQTPEQMLTARIHKKNNSHVLLFSLSYVFVENSIFVNLVDESYILFWDLKTNIMFFFNKIIRVPSIIHIIFDLFSFFPWLFWSTTWLTHHTFWPNDINILVTMGAYHIYLSAKAAWVQW